MRKLYRFMTAGALSLLGLLTWVTFYHTFMR